MTAGIVILGAAFVLFALSTVAGGITAHGVLRKRPLRLRGAP